MADAQVKTGRGKEGFRALCGGCSSRVSAGKVGPREGRGDPGSPKGGLGREVGLFFFLRK